VTAVAERHVPVRRTDPLLVLCSIASVQCGSALARTAFDDLGATGITVLRLGISALLLLVVLRPRFGRWDRRAWRAATLLGVCMASMNLVFYLSLRTVPLGIAVTVEFCGPLLLALAQTRRWLDAAWALLAATGVALLGFDPSGDVPLGGLALAFLAGLCWAGYIVATARVGQVLPGLDGLSGALCVGALLVVPFGAHRAWAVVDRPSLLLVGVGVALLSSVVSYGLEMIALRRIPTRVFGVLMSIEPGAAAIAGFVVLDEALGAREIVALLLVSTASAATTLTHRASTLATPSEHLAPP
jgi:inner membrane transporter RhtA